MIVLTLLMALGTWQSLDQAVPRVLLATAGLSAQTLGAAGCTAQEAAQIADRIALDQEGLQALVTAKSVFEQKTTELAHVESLLHLGDSGQAEHHRTLVAETANALQLFQSAEQAVRLNGLQALSPEASERVQRCFVRRGLRIDSAIAVTAPTGTQRLPTVVTQLRRFRRASPETRQPLSETAQDVDRALTSSVLAIEGPVRTAEIYSSVREDTGN